MAKKAIGIVLRGSDNGDEVRASAAKLVCDILGSDYHDRGFAAAPRHFATTAPTPAVREGGGGGGPPGPGGGGGGGCQGPKKFDFKKIQSRCK